MGWMRESGMLCCNWVCALPAILLLRGPTTPQRKCSLHGSSSVGPLSDLSQIAPRSLPDRKRSQAIASARQIKTASGSPCQIKRDLARISWNHCPRGLCHNANPRSGSTHSCQTCSVIVRPACTITQNTHCGCSYSLFPGGLGEVPVGTS